MKKLPSKKNSAKTKMGDPLLLIAIFSLLLFGVFIVYDVSIVYASNVLGGKYYFLILQSIWVLLGCVGFSAGYITDYHKLHKIAGPLFLLSLLALVFVILPTPFSPLIYGAKRWIFLNPEPFPRLPVLGRIGFQPSELVKLAFIMYFSVLFSKDKVKLMNFLVLLGLLIMLVLRQPDMGTAMLITGIAIAMYFVSGANLLYFLGGIPTLFAFILFFILSSPYRKERLLTHIGSSQDTLGSGYHINQIMIALGSGGLFGVGLGQSRQKYEYIPEPATDSIFAVIGEELGFVGLLILVSAFLFIIFRGYRIAANAPDKFGQLLACGITSWFGVQCLVNLSAMVKLIPLTGVPLPLISYGGSSMIFLMTGLGILMNISKHCDNL